MRRADLSNGAVALYGRFLTAPRAAYVAALEDVGARLARDLTRGSDLFVVGLGAGRVAASGALGDRLAVALSRGVQIFSEERLRDLLFPPDDGATAIGPTAPVATALKEGGLDPRALGVLAAFDAVRIDATGTHCRFADVAPLRQAAALIAEGVPPFEAARTLRAARAAPPGRRQVVAVADAPSGGHVALSWDDGAEFTGLDGQRFLPLDLEDGGEDPFDAAMEAEADGDREAAARLYAASAQADPRDPIAPFNLGNLQMAQGDADAATLSYHQAIARDPGFAEAYYNLAAAYERTGAAGKAEATLEAALQRDPAYGDALFNLGQLKLAKGANAEASALFEAYLAQDPPDEWAGKARKALRVAQADPPR